MKSLYRLQFIQRRLSTFANNGLTAMFPQPPYLAGGAVGHARAPIVGQVEVGGTGALVASSGGEQAQVTAAPVVCLAGMVQH